MNLNTPIEAQPTLGAYPAEVWHHMRMVPAGSHAVVSSGGACPHSSLRPPPFDEKASASMSSSEVRRRWPRSADKCPGCGSTVVQYASFMHYIAGDW